MRTIQGPVGLLLRMLLTIAGLLTFAMVLSGGLEKLLGVGGLRALVMALVHLGITLYFLCLGMWPIVIVVVELGRFIQKKLKSSTWLFSHNVDEDTSYRIRIAMAIYTILIHVYPVSIVSNHEDEMMVDFGECLDKHGQRLGWWFFTEMAKSLFGAVQAHLQQYEFRWGATR